MSALTAERPIVAGRRAAASAPPAWLRERGMGASILVAAISSAFGVVLISTTDYIAAFLRADPFVGDSDTLAFVLSFLTVLLVGVAVYVAAIVTANTFATVIAGRTRRIALLRLIGASARGQRAEVARQGLIVGALGAMLGLVGGTAIAAIGLGAADAAWGLSVPDFALVQPVLLVPAVIVALTTWAAAWAGSRRVLAVTPCRRSAAQSRPRVSRSPPARGAMSAPRCSWFRAPPCSPRASRSDW